MGWFASHLPCSSSPPVLPVSVSVSATEPVSGLTSAETERKKEKRWEEGWEGVAVLAEMALRGGGKRREVKKLSSWSDYRLSQYDLPANPLQPTGPENKKQ